MSWRIIVISKRAKLDLQLGYMVVRSEEVTKVVLSEISTILIESTAVSLTTSLLAELTRRKIKVIFCDEKKNPSSELISYYGSHDTSNKIRKQIAWRKNTKEAVWTEIVTEKIRKQKELLEIMGKEEAELLSSYLKEIVWNDTTNREGHAAKVYFNELFGKQFVRVTQQEADVINAGLNYGYAIMRAQMARIVAGYGLNGLLGIFHKNEYNQFNLIDDLMEPFRQIVDVWVYDNLRDQEFLKYEYRLGLTDLLNAKIKYGKETCSVTVAMDKYVKGFIKYISEKDSSKFHCPVVSSLEWRK